MTDKPGSVVDSHSSRPAITHWLKQPTRVQYGPYHVNPYLALLRVEFTVPRTVTSRAVRSYRTLSPLPDPACAGHRRFALCCTGRGFPPQALPGTLPYGARTFLPFICLPLTEDGNKAATVWSTSARIIGQIAALVIPDYRRRRPAPAHSDTTHSFSRHEFRPSTPQLSSTAARHAASARCATPLPVTPPRPADDPQQ